MRSELQRLEGSGRRPKTGGTQVQAAVGYYFDGSETQINGIQAHGNLGTGVLLRNVFGFAADNIRATANGGHGIQVLGCVGAAGGSWVAFANGYNPSWAPVQSVGPGTPPMIQPGAQTNNDLETASGLYVGSYSLGSTPPNPVDVYFDGSTFGSTAAAKLGTYGLTDQCAM